MPRLALLGALLVGSVVAAVLLTRETVADRSNADAQARARAHAVLLASQAVALDSARGALVQKTADFAHIATRYVRIRDSLFIPVSHTDTVAVLTRLPQFLAVADSEHRACTAVVESCEAFRVRAETSLAGLTVDRDLWKGIAESQRPSRWSRVQEWGLRIGIAYVSYRVGRAAH